MGGNKKFATVNLELKRRFDKLKSGLNLDWKWAAGGNEVANVLRDDDAFVEQIFLLSLCVQF